MIVTETRRRAVPARALAVLAAVLMIGAAVAVRQLVLDDEDGTGGSVDGTQGALTVVCVRELRDVCAVLDADVIVEGVDETLTRFAGGPSDVDAWLTFAPLADEIAGAEDGAVLARTPLVLAARSDRAAVLRDHCGAQPTWRCLGTVADEPWSDIGGDARWGDVRPAHAEPVTSALGRLVVGQAVASYFGTDAFQPIDWQADVDFGGWFQQLERAVPADAFDSGVDPFARWIGTRPVGARYDAVATTEAQALTRLATAAPDVRDAVMLIYPAPMATADVVLQPAAEGLDVSSLDGALRAALRDAGYRVDRSPPPGAPGDAGALGDGDGLPAGAVLTALTAYWESVVR